MYDLLYSTSLEMYREKKDAYLEGQHENASRVTRKEILALVRTALYPVSLGGSVMLTRILC